MVTFGFLGFVLLKVITSPDFSQRVLVSELVHQLHNQNDLILIYNSIRSASVQVIYVGVGSRKHLLLFYRSVPI
jgi:hypothetical protein